METDMQLPVINDEYLAKSQSIFLSPKTLYPWEEIVNGATVVTSGGKVRTMTAVAGNTFRGYHRKKSYIQKLCRKNQSCIGASEDFKKYFTENHFQILYELTNKTFTNEDMNILSNNIFRDLLPQLRRKIKEEKLSSYNRVRKPIDLYLEHLAAMAEDIDANLRRRFVSLLFLPLDSWIFGNMEIFTEEELRQYGFRRKSTYSCVLDEAIYNALQELLKNKAKENSRLLNRQFHRIYFDMFWNNRYMRTGNNLFECN